MHHLIHKTLITITLSLTLIACGGGGSSGAASTGAASTGAASTGAASTGAASTGAASTGAASTGTTSTGAASTGAASTGAASTGAASTGAASTGAASTGAASTDAAPAVVAPTDLAETVVIPTVIKTTPADQATGVARDAMITATLSKIILPSSIDNKHFTLRSPSGAVNTSVSQKNVTATLIPDDSLTLLTPYTATLSKTISDIESNVLGTDVSWTFTTEDGNWGPAERLHKGTSGLGKRQIAIDKNGNALVSWWSQDDNDYQLYIIRYAVNSGWGVATKIYKIDKTAIVVGAPNITFGSNGDLLLTWNKYNTNGGELWVKRYTEGTGWANAKILKSNTRSVSAITDNHGKIFVVWAMAKSNNQGHDIWSSRYTEEAGWEENKLISTSNTEWLGTLTTAPDNNGNPLVVWRKAQITRLRGQFEYPYIPVVNNYTLWSCSYTANKGWGAATQIDANNGEEIKAPQLAINNNGKALAIWEQFTDGFYSIWSNHYTAGQGWGTATLIEKNNSGKASSPKIAISNNGSALAVWRQEYNRNKRTIYANRYTEDNGWSRAIRIDKGDTYYYPEIAIDNNGNGLAIWENHNNDNNLLSRYTAGKGWSTAAPINGGEIHSTGPKVAIDHNGKALTIWVESHNDVRNIWANRLE